MQINKLPPSLKSFGGRCSFRETSKAGSKMPGNFLRIIPLVLACVAALVSSASAADRPAVQELREETWALMTPLPIFAYVVRPVGGGPYPLLIMNHGISGDPQQRGFFPFVEFRDAAHWFARRGYFVVSPVRYGGVSIDQPEKGLFSLYFADVRDCDKPNFRWPGLMIATLNQWVIDFMEKEAIVAPGKAIVVGQSGGGWGARHRSGRSSPLQQVEADALMVSRTIIALPTSSSKQRAISE